MKKKIVVTRKFFEDAILEKLEDFELCFWEGDSSPSEKELIVLSRGAFGMLTMLSDSMSREVIEELDSSVRIIANYAVGFNNIDIEAASEREIIVTNTPEVLTDAVAELVVGMMIGIGRGFEFGIREVRQEKFMGWEPAGYLGTQIKGKRVGIIGAGRIGTAIGSRLESFGCDLVYSSRSSKKGLIMCELDELIATSDFIVLSCSLTDETHHLINKKRLIEMKVSAFLINIGRGALIDEAELIRALQEKRIGGAALDVYEHEPTVPVELRELSNVLLLPHIGSATYQTRYDMLDLALDNIKKVAFGEKAVTPVN